MCDGRRSRGCPHSGGPPRIEWAAGATASHASREGLVDAELGDYAQVIDALTRWQDYYNCHRPHSALRDLRPVEYYRGDPQARLAERQQQAQSGSLGPYISSTGGSMPMPREGRTSHKIRGPVCLKFRWAGQNRDMSRMGPDDPATLQTCETSVDTLARHTNQRGKVPLGYW